MLDEKKEKVQEKPVEKPCRANCGHCKGTGKHLGSNHPCTFCHGQ